MLMITLDPLVVWPIKPQSVQGWVSYRHANSIISGLLSLQGEVKKKEKKKEIYPDFVSHVSQQ